MKPGLGTLEKLSEVLGVGVNRFFVPETNGDTLLEDPFIQELRPFLRQLDWNQWQSILKRLAAISGRPRAISSLGTASVGSNGRLDAPADSCGRDKPRRVG
jgi:hypothetical protein